MFRSTEAMFLIPFKNLHSGNLRATALDLPGTGNIAVPANGGPHRRRIASAIKSALPLDGEAHRRRSALPHVQTRRVDLCGVRIQTL